MPPVREHGGAPHLGQRAQKDGNNVSLPKSNKTIDFQSDYMLAMESLCATDHFPRLCDIPQPLYAYTRQAHPFDPVLDKFIQRKKVNYTYKSQDSGDYPIAIECCDFTSDGRYLMSAGEFSLVALHNTFDFSFFYTENIPFGPDKRDMPKHTIKRLRFIPANNNHIVCLESKGVAVILDPVLTPKDTKALTMKQASDLSIFSDGRLIACSEENGDIYLSRLGATSLKQDSRVFCHKNGVAGVDLHPFSALLASAGKDGQLCISDIRINTGYSLMRDANAPSAAAGQPQSQAVWRDDPAPKFSNSLVLSVTPCPTVAMNELSFVRWHQGGTLVAAGCPDATVKLYDIRMTNQPVSQCKLQWKPTCMRWNPRFPDWFAVGDAGGNIYFYDVQTFTRFHVPRWIGWGDCGEASDQLSDSPYGVTEDRALAPLLAQSLGASVSGLASSLAPSFPGADQLAEQTGSSSGRHDPMDLVLQGQIKRAHRPESRATASVVDLTFHPGGHILATVGSERDLRFWSSTRPGALLRDVFHLDTTDGIDVASDEFSHNKSHKGIDRTISTAYERINRQELMGALRSVRKEGSIGVRPLPTF